MKIPPETLHKVFFWGNIAAWVLIVIGFLVFMIQLIMK